ncbi:hypothetical protein B0H16DRAFT_1836187 [Mycena metata]|uniref:Uncharacterized protein n=1 Tax=Mycena metata TaxID=1033252 RepID=A0AAD7J090_9AGAR|nr:hypothetical protein B0H16DRAFT_1836187 [Mycena metata]
MADAHPEPEFATKSDSDDGSSNESTGAFFPGAREFKIDGGTFSSTTNIYHSHSSSTIPANFRRIPLGDVDLRREIRVDSASGIVKFSPPARRVYSARIHGNPSNTTAVLYQGERAEEEWRAAVSYSRLRHPHIVQIFGVTDDAACRAAEQLKDATEYCESQGLRYAHFDGTEWIRLSTGQLCIELGVSSPHVSRLAHTWNTNVGGRLSLLELDENGELIDALSPTVFYTACVHLKAEWPHLSICADDSESIEVGAIAACTPFNTVKIIASVANFLVSCCVCALHDTPSFIMENGWTRLTSCALGDIGPIPDDFSSIIYSIDVRDNDEVNAGCSWLSQANHVFTQLGIHSNRDQYVLVTNINYHLRSSGSAASIPPGYLFICPPRDLQVSNNSPKFRPIKDDDFYWSLDPSGVERLSLKEALDLKFPFIDFDMEIWGYSWDDTVYACLGEFHERKGIEGDSQNIARDLDFPIYQISKGLHIPFALEPYGELGGNDSSIREENTTSSDELVVNFALTCDDLEVFTPSWIWNILICFQIGLIVSLAIFSFVDCLHMCM